MLITAKSQKEVVSHCKKNSDNDSINSGNDTIQLVDHDYDDEIFYFNDNSNNL